MWYFIFEKNRTKDIIRSRQMRQRCLLIWETPEFVECIFELRKVMFEFCQTIYYITHKGIRGILITGKFTIRTNYRMNFQEKYQINYQLKIWKILKKIGYKASITSSKVCFEYNLVSRKLFFTKYFLITVCNFWFSPQLL